MATARTTRQVSPSERRGRRSGDAQDDGEAGDMTVAECLAMAPKACHAGKPGGTGFVASVKSLRLSAVPPHSSDDPGGVPAMTTVPRRVLRSQSGIVLVMVLLLRAAARSAMAKLPAARRGGLQHRHHATARSRPRRWRAAVCDSPRRSCSKTSAARARRRPDSARPVGARERSRPRRGPDVDLRVQIEDAGAASI